jgi:hypothetical protein
MGAHGAYGAIRRDPDLFAAAYVECGTGNTDMADILAEIPFWIFHGSEDPIVPVQGSRNMYKAIREAGGIQVRYTEYPGVGHNTWDYTKDETTLPWWLLAQRKGSFHGSPQNVSKFNCSMTVDHAVKILWEYIADSAIEDNQMWFCRIYRNNNLIGEIYNDHSQYIDKEVIPDSTYYYQITAVNFFFKESAKSPALAITVE